MNYKGIYFHNQKTSNLPNHSLNKYLLRKDHYFKSLYKYIENVLKGFSLMIHCKNHSRNYFYCSAGYDLSNYD